MAESMQGLHRSHRCTEVNNTYDRRGSYADGMGAEKKKFRKSDLR